jgi:Domain of unknown function (DUF5615)
MARFYSNETQTAVEAGNANLRVADEAVLAYAAAANRAISTINRKHFGLHNRNPARCGIIVCSLDSDFSRQANRIHEAVTFHADLPGLLIRVNRPDQRTSGSHGR